ncbi:hypothetical protein D3C84_1061960 [compost metagenome]
MLAALAITVESFDQQNGTASKVAELGLGNGDTGIVGHRQTRVLGQRLIERIISLRELGNPLLAIRLNGHLRASATHA